MSLSYFFLYILRYFLLTSNKLSPFRGFFTFFHIVNKTLHAFSTLSMDRNVEKPAHSSMQNVSIFMTPSSRENEWKSAIYIYIETGKELMTASLGNSTTTVFFVLCLLFYSFIRVLNNIEPGLGWVFSLKNETHSSLFWWEDQGRSFTSLHLFILLILLFC